MLREDANLAKRSTCREQQTGSGKRGQAEQLEVVLWTSSRVKVESVEHSDDVLVWR